jgi:hypothetical protein
MIGTEPRSAANLLSEINALARNRQIAGGPAATEPQGVGNDIGVYGLDNSTLGGGYGVYGYSATGNAGAAGLSSSGVGVLAESSSNYGLFGESNTSDGVDGDSGSGSGVYGYSHKADGVTASSTYGRAITAHSLNAAHPTSLLWQTFSGLRSQATPKGRLGDPTTRSPMRAPSTKARVASITSGASSTS